ncbi:RNA-dependent RNA polymerase 2 [Aristolochia californica]|uniref:RNA-dependent RNA polymerase 2 n=1 Tax=Aristolochia californica TaxID=171875 RepID=UPI0035DB730A
MPFLTMADATTTVRVSKIPLLAVATELLEFFETTVGENTVFACEISSYHKNWKSKGVGRVQFDNAEAAERAVSLSAAGKLIFQQAFVEVSPCLVDIIIRPIEPRNRVNGGILHVGFLSGKALFGALESWNHVTAEIMPERRRAVFSVVEGGQCYKMEIEFTDLIGVFECHLSKGEANGVLLQMKYGPRIYHKIKGPSIAPKFGADRYHVCKEDVEFLWVRTTDFSSLKSIGQSTHFCWELTDGFSASEIISNFHSYKEYGHLEVEPVKPFCSGSELVPIMYCMPHPILSYEILFQLNSLIHAQKLVATAVNLEFLNILSGLTEETANKVLLKLHKLKSTCYEPVQFVQHELYSIQKSKLSLDSYKSIPADRNLMSCHRVLITPSKVYFMGPEIETSNYVVQHFSAYASNFLRVSFVEEDWSKLPPGAISTRTGQGISSKTYRTQIFQRIHSILEKGIVIGAKRFEFLAFSASQLRANSIWMFAPTESLSAEKIRDWMGYFNKINCVSKFSARMGQLFSSSIQSFSVPAHDVQVIPDIEATIDGIKYCFSDGIGKISLSFAKQVAQKIGLNHTPSAFQIRYGGYKGVVSVDRTSFRKLSLRRSMLKFDSKNTMLCVTKWSESVPCFLNREIVSLLSTLGIKDGIFESMQREQMAILEEMLSNKEAALNVLEGMVGGDAKLALVKMLLHDYEPNLEPYLSMMLRAYREFQLSDIRTKCRIFVPKGRVLLGCLDEIGSLEYGQVYIRVSMTKAEQEASGQSQSFFKKVDACTAVVVGKVVVTKNPCLHPGDIRVLEAIWEPGLEEMGLVDCIMFPQKGLRPHPNECSGGDLDGDLYFVCWDHNLVPSNADTPMDYLGRLPRLLDHEVSLEEVHNFFIDYMINDTLGVISTAHLVHSDREPLKARSPKCLRLAMLQSMAVDFAKTGAPAEMPRVLKPKEYPDFLERGDRPVYSSPGILGKLYRATIGPSDMCSPVFIWSKDLAQMAYDPDLEVPGFEDFLEKAEKFKHQYIEKLTALMNYYEAEREDEIVTGNLRKRSHSLNRDKKKYGEMKDRILVAVKNLQKEVKEWFNKSCNIQEKPKMASAWYHVTYHPNYYGEENFLSFPWIMSDVLLNIKSLRGTTIRQNR